MQIIKKREEDKYTGERRIATLLPKHSDHTSPYLKKKNQYGYSTRKQIT